MEIEKENTFNLGSYKFFPPVGSLSRPVKVVLYPQYKSKPSKQTLTGFMDRFQKYSPNGLTSPANITLISFENSYRCLQSVARERGNIYICNQHENNILTSRGCFNLKFLVCFPWLVQINQSNVISIQPNITNYTFVQGGFAVCTQCDTLCPQMLAWYKEKPPKKPHDRKT